ncbi:DNA starvation/stationary phase protection protein [Thalassococcus sp. CAU 1522]|uniref:DNA starvation/stationary phase protection protein n=1 Tax=Thalassococcus arenae TaxID=2851652 RepID=A0ABS6N2Z1_9RHOB|nr:DNA starvation/stationary phase protection protein [Thalassococcus arenae]MBV2358385.1 DNA starvation/stationary phase protection protein [Thalassococcus arenae]
MTDALKVVPSKDRVSTGVRDTEAVAQGLADVLADTYRLVFKTHAYHWNVEGPLFYAVHNLTEGQYEEMFAAADELAERIRALGHLAPWQLSAVMEMSRVKDAEGLMSANDMLDDLASDHENLAHRLHALVELAEDSKDPVTEDLATERSTFHEKAAWMLRALAKS